MQSNNEKLWNMDEQEKIDGFLRGIFDDPMLEQGRQVPAPASKPPAKPPEQTGVFLFKQRKGNVERITGHPIYNVRWDDLGLGLMPQMGYVPNKNIVIDLKGDKWSITGARFNSPLLLFLALGAGGAFHFLQDLLQQMHGNWTWVAGLIATMAPTILNLVIRVHTKEMYAFELDFVGYDPENRTLILSTVTEPGGIVAIKVDLPANEKARKVEEVKMIEALRRAHSGFMLIGGTAREVEPSAIKEWSLWAFIWVLIWTAAIWFYLSTRH